MTDVIIEAQDYARKAHEDQLDDMGKPYFDAHIHPVALSITELCPEDVNLIAAAYLHDTIEDTDITYEDLKASFNEDIADLVQEVTHVKHPKGSYFPWLNTARGITLKLIDRASNVSRMDPWNDKRKKRYLEKTKFWYSEPVVKGHIKYPEWYDCVEPTVRHLVWVLRNAGFNTTNSCGCDEKWVDVDINPAHLDFLIKTLNKNNYSKHIITWEYDNKLGAAWCKVVVP